MLSWGLCFGDFHLPQQMKVTRPPGRDPASSAGTTQALKKSLTPRANMHLNGGMNNLLQR